MIVPLYLVKKLPNDHIWIFNIGQIETVCMYVLLLYLLICVWRSIYIETEKKSTWH
jgi:hypothetical protein